MNLQKLCPNNANALGTYVCAMLLKKVSLQYKYSN